MKRAGVYLRPVRRGPDLDRCQAVRNVAAAELTARVFAPAPQRAIALQPAAVPRLGLIRDPVTGGDFDPRRGGPDLEWTGLRAGRVAQAEVTVGVVTPAV